MRSTKASAAQGGTTCLQENRLGHESTVSGRDDMKADLTCRILTEFAELEGFSAEWIRLQNCAGRSEIFQDFLWVKAWWQCFRKDYRLFTPTVFREGRIIGILPMVLTGRQLRFLGHSVSDYNHLLAEPGEGHAVLESCYDKLFTHAHDWDEVLLENIPETSLLVECIRSLPHRYRRAIVESLGDPCPTMLLTGDKRAVLTPSMNKLKRAVNRLRRLDTLTFRHFEDPAEAAAHLPKFFRQHIRRSALAGRRSAFLDDDYRSFYSDLLNRFWPERAIRFSVLELGNRAIAYHFGFLYERKYLWYKPSFDVDLWELAPGQVMLWFLFDNLLVTDAEEFDFGRGDETFKHRFSNHVRQNLNFTCYAPGYRHAARRGYRGLCKSTKVLVRKFPTLDRIAWSLRGQWRTIRRSCRRDGGWQVLRKLARVPILDRNELWLISIDAPARNVPGQQAVTVDETTLSEMADLVTAFPDFLTDDALLRARELLRHEKTAWIASLQGMGQMLVWSSVNVELGTPTGAFPLPHKSMVILEIWPLSTRVTKTDLVTILRQVAAIADEKGLPTRAFCQRQILPSERVLRTRGVTPEYRWVQSRVRKSRWNRRSFGKNGHA